MNRRNILKALFFGQATAHALVSKSEPVYEVEQEQVPDSTHHFKSKWHQLTGIYWNEENLYASNLGDWCIQNGELICLVSKPDRTVQLLSHHLTGENKAFNVEMVFKFLNNPEVQTNNLNATGFRLGEKGEAVDYVQGIDAGISRSGNLFIGKTISNKKINENILKEKVRLVLTVTPKSNSGEYFAKLKALDRSGNTLATISSAEYGAWVWTGNIAILSNSESQSISDTPTLAISSFEIEGEKLTFCAGFEPANLNNQNLNIN